MSSRTEPASSVFTPMSQAEGQDFLKQVGLATDAAAIAEIGELDAGDVQAIRAILDTNNDNRIDSQDRCMKSDWHATTLRFAESFFPALADEWRGDVRPNGQRDFPVSVDKKSGQITVGGTTYPTGTFSSFELATEYFDDSVADAKKELRAMEHKYRKLDYSERQNVSENYEFTQPLFNADLARETMIDDVIFPAGATLQINFLGQVRFAVNSVPYTAHGATIPAGCKTEFSALYRNQMWIELPNTAGGPTETEFMGTRFPAGTQVNVVFWGNSSRIESAQTKTEAVIEDQLYPAGTKLWPVPGGAAFPVIEAHDVLDVSDSKGTYRANVGLILRVRTPEEAKSRTFPKEWLADPSRVIVAQIKTVYGFADREREVKDAERYALRRLEGNPVELRNGKWVIVEESNY